MNDKLVTKETELPNHCGSEPLKFAISNKVIRVKFPQRRDIINEADFGSIGPSQELHNTTYYIILELH